MKHPWWTAFAVWLLCPFVAAAGFVGWMLWFKPETRAPFLIVLVILAFLLLGFYLADKAHAEKHRDD